MSTTSPNFHLTLATTSDPVSVVDHISAPLTTLDSILAVAHTGSGQLKAGLPLSQPLLTSPVFTGSVSGSFSISAGGSLVCNTITATAGVLTLQTLTASACTIGNWVVPAAIGTTGDVLTVNNGTASFIPQAPGTGAARSLANLSAVAINTSLNNFTASAVTVDLIRATAGTFSGLTFVNATTGTYGGLTVAGTCNAQVVNCTGGQGTFGGITVGTYALPATIGTNGNVLMVATGTLSFGLHTDTTVYGMAYGSTSVNISITVAAQRLPFGGKVFDTASIFNTATNAYQYTITAPGYYSSSVSAHVTPPGTNRFWEYDLILHVGTKDFHKFRSSYITTSAAENSYVQGMNYVTSGQTIYCEVSCSNSSNGGILTVTAAGAFSENYFTIHKIPDA